MIQKSKLMELRFFPTKMKILQMENKLILMQNKLLLIEIKMREKKEKGK